ncbi:MAG: alanine--tRNA ligase-related protein, partial [Acidobacteriota bacterium]|nr:alanine--tRNA ligase-related protein [Acidobacteriota bacterium]
MSVYETFDEQKQFACRVIADHARTTAFSIADGILPGNEGRAYVLRKIMRRAIYHGREHLNFHEAFFYKVCNKVVDEMKDAYPELETQREFIGKMVRLEEERFGNTMTVGLKKLHGAINSYFLACEQTAESRLEEKDEVSGFDFPIPISELKEQRIVWRTNYRNGNSNVSEKKISSWENLISKAANVIENPEHIETILIPDLAELYDTYGTPKDLIFVTLRDYDFEFSDSEFDEIFDKAIKELQQNSDIGKTKQKENLKPIYVAMERTATRSKFHGYDATQIENTKVIKIIKDDNEINELKEGEEGLIVLSDTPFYAESGGQVGDTGWLVRTARVSGRVDAENHSIQQANDLPPAHAGGSDTARIKVLDTFAPVKDLNLHKSRVEKGSIKVGDELTATVDADKRDATRRNHTATHLVHAALREVLGTHVKQAGSVVAPQFLRFDFTHYQPISADEIRQIEDLVNHYILQNEAVTTNVMAIEEAMQTGAMALFGEKYGSAVRVLSVGEGVFSKELCGGTHVRATGDIGSFKITSDEAVASGVRRIRAITGFDAFERFRDDERMIDESLQFLKTQRDQLPNAIEKLQEELKRTRRENDDLKMKIATGAIGSAASNGDEAKEISGVKVIAKTVEGLDKGGMRHLSDTLMA